MKLRRSDVPIRDLDPLETLAHARRRSELRKLSDDELVQTARSPQRGDPLVINTRTGKMYDGNGRAHELRRRADDPSSSISFETLVPVEYYTPDYSMFPDIDE